MLLQRLQDRCPSAKALGTAWTSGYYLSFGKKGADGSGKAAIIKTGAKDDVVHGVLFELSQNELTDLDKFELNYQRNDQFKVSFNGEKCKVTTYYIPESEIEIGLLPTDWYRDLCVAGAQQNGLDADYITRFEQLIVHKDPDNEAHKYLRNLTEDS